jgi:phosphoenolpyruvate carboxykinase (ATP)
MLMHISALFSGAMIMAGSGDGQNAARPRNTWSEKSSYDATAQKLAGLFRSNFEKYADGASPDVRAAGPAAK